MPELVGPNGQPIDKYMAFKNKKSPAPTVGDKYAAWGGPNSSVMSLPGGGAIMFDLDRLDVGDFRQMRDDYQISASLAVLTFLLHQMDWRIVCDDAKQKTFYTEQIENMWTPLVRSMSQSFWAGYSPNVIDWENDVGSRRIVVDKIHDLVPEAAAVRWKKIEGVGTHKISVFDGIKQLIGPSVPVENSFWYPCLMENGNYYGRKLLRPAFQPWFFSILLHLFANRYFERYGEPTPVGRAPFDDDIRFMGEEMKGNQAMEVILNQLRNRSAVVLPNDKTSWSDSETKPDFDYQIEYLESQMRGADFERYMTRLDEEKSLALFTPILMMRTASVGSYNLGNTQGMTYRWMLNAVAGDWREYVNWYLLKPMRDFNFGTNASLPKIQFRRLGAENEDLVRDVVRALIAKGGVKPDLEQLGEIAGLTLSEVQAVTAAPAQPGDPTQPSQAPDGGAGSAGNRTENRLSVRLVTASLSERIEQQVVNAFDRDKLREVQFSLGFQRKFESALVDSGVEDAAGQTKRFYQMLEGLLNDMVGVGYGSPESFMLALKGHLDWMVDRILLDAAS